MKPLLIIAIAATAMLSACRSQQRLAYFEDLDAIEAVVAQTADYRVPIVPDDELLITVNSAVPGATAEYNLPLSNPALYETMPATTTPQQQTFVVAGNGCIDFPSIGSVRAAGLTTDQLTDTLTRLIGRHVKDPMVKVALVNFKVNVLGEVARPQTVNVRGQRFTVLDAIARAGDLTEYGRRDRIVIIRETPDGERVFHRLSLLDSSITSSPYFYLRQNDVVYVEPNDVKKSNSSYNTNNAYRLSVISTIASAVSIIASLAIALTKN